MEHTKKCPYCGEEILAVAKKCKHCGEWLDKDAEHTSFTEQQPTQPERTNIPKKKSVNKGVIATILAVLVLVIVAGFIMHGQQSKESYKTQAVKEDPVINFAEPEENEDGTVYYKRDSEKSNPNVEEDGGENSEPRNGNTDSGNSNPEELLSLGESYEKGIGVEKNLETAFYYYQKAAETGDPAALNKMGNMYAEGKGCVKNMPKAASYYLAAAEKGNRYAQHNIAFCYWDGAGIEKNRESAVMWMRRSAAQGCEKAMKALKIMGVE